MRNPRAEATVRIGNGLDVRVLEPSPPAMNEPPWFADDPVAGGDVVPVDRPGTRSWAALCDQRNDDDLRAWCRDRWLVPGPVHPLPDHFGPTRSALHALAEHVLAPARHAATGKIGLRFTYHGFGTPFFASDRQVRIEDGRLYDGDGSIEPSTLRAAAEFVGVLPGAQTGVYEPTTADDADAALAIDAPAAAAIGEWFGFCASVLEQFRAEATAADDPARVQLWPEHFDLAVDLGPPGARANFGGSPGDEQHPEPYLYIGPWEPRTGDFWNESFGASLSYSALRAGADPLEFLRTGKDIL